MNNIKKILAEQEAEFDKKFGFKRDIYSQNFKESIKSFLRQSQKTLIEQVIKELVGEERKKENKECRCKNPGSGPFGYCDCEFSEEAGYNQHRAEAKAKGEEILDQL